MFKILVCGGRDFNDYSFLKTALQDIMSKYIDVDEFEIIHGAARGADSLAGKFAKEFGYKETKFPADWNKYGKSAGFKRNKQMIDEGKPDIVVAFPGGKGTTNMKILTKEYGIRLYEYN